MHSPTQPQRKLQLALHVATKNSDTQKWKVASHASCWPTVAWIVDAHGTRSRRRIWVINDRLREDDGVEFAFEACGATYIYDLGVKNKSRRLILFRLLLGMSRRGVDRSLPTPAGANTSHTHHLRYLQLLIDHGQPTHVPK